EAQGERGPEADELRSGRELGANAGHALAPGEVRHGASDEEGGHDDEGESECKTGARHRPIIARPARPSVKNVLEDESALSKIGGGRRLLRALRAEVKGLPAACSL